MTGWTRRDVLRVGAGAAMVAVPMAALATSPAGAATSGAAGTGPAPTGPDTAGGGSVLFSVLDASRGEVAIYHGRHEVIVQDRDLVARIMRAADAAAR